MGIQRRRRRTRGTSRSETDNPVVGYQPSADQDDGPDEAHRPTPHDLAERASAFAFTSGVQDPDAEPPDESTSTQTPIPTQTPTPAPAAVAASTAGEPDRSEHRRAEQYRLDSEDPHVERGLRGLVGGGSSQVSVAAAMRARDAARPTEADLAAAESTLVIIRRGWAPREDRPRTGRR